MPARQCRTQTPPHPTPLQSRSFLPARFLALRRRLSGGVSPAPGPVTRPPATLCFCRPPPEAEPEVEHLFVSDITDGGFRLSWTSDEDTFDRFVVKVRDGKRLAHPREYAVRGDERTMVVTGLMSGTEYEIELYGVALDKRSQPVTGVAHTGTWKRHRGVTNRQSLQ